VFKNLRIKIFNWFAAGKMTLTYEKPQEYKLMSTYTIAGGYSGGITLNPSYTTPTNTLTLKITPANGGTIVSVQNPSGQEDLHIIPDGVDFDRELGKIITMNRLKS